MQRLGELDFLDEGFFYFYSMFHIDGNAHTTILGIFLTDFQRQQMSMTIAQIHALKNLVDKIPESA